MRRLFHLLSIVCVCLMPVFAGMPAVKRPVVIDIGHQYTASGAESPDGKINEYAFWAQYAIEVRKEVEAAGYPCIIINRSEAPTKEPLATYNKESGVIHLNKPDKNAKRYSSTHHPEHIGAGMISADYAIDQNALCVVFLHLNSVGSKWSTTPPTGLIICNKEHGNALGEAVCAAMREDLLDQPDGMPNAKKGIKVMPRHIGSQSGAGWMNTLDAEKIPAIIFEAVYVNNRGHIDFISKDANARKLARTIGKGVVNWLKATHPIVTPAPLPPEHPMPCFTMEVYPADTVVCPRDYVSELVQPAAVLVQGYTVPEEKPMEAAPQEDTAADSSAK